MSTISVTRLVEQIHESEIQLPDFQREFVWRPEKVRELLVSVLAGYFIGSLLILEQLYKEAHFKLKPISGVELLNPKNQNPKFVKVLLDGQQRASALYYALYEPEIGLRGTTKPYRFFLNLKKALEEDWDNAVDAVKATDKKEIAKREKEHYVIPFTFIRKENIHEFTKRFTSDPKFTELFKIVNDFRERPINRADLDKETDPKRISEIFARINRWGEVLSIFDLVVASLYKHGIKLREKLADTKTKHEFARVTNPEYILKVIALFREKETKRGSLLELVPKNFEDHWEKACRALQDAYIRITDTKDGYGVLKFKKWIPYTPMIVPLAAALEYLKSRKLETPKNYQKLDRWYWTTVFSARYDEGVDGKSEQDVKALMKWFKDERKVPDFIKDFEPADVDLTASRQSSAVYRGVMSLVVLKGAWDFMSGKPPKFDSEKIQDDHIFPKSKFGHNEVINRTLITSNAAKGDDKPSTYFKKILKIHGKAKFTEIMESHLVPKSSFKCLLSDKLEKFIEKRRQAIISEVRKRVN